MTNEFIERLAEKPEEINALLANKEETLPKSIRVYIRRLKGEGKWETGIKFREQFIKQRIRNRRQSAERELNDVIYDIIKVSDPSMQAELEVKAVWLMFAAGMLQSDERVKNIIDILDSKGKILKEQLENNLPRIRDEMRQYLPKDS